MKQCAQLMSYTRQRIVEALNVKINSKSAFLMSRYTVTSASNDGCLMANETRFKQSSVLVGARAFEDARVVRVINSLDGLPRAWLLHRYLDSPADWDRLKIISIWLYEKVRDDLRASGRSLREKKSLKRLEALCLLFVQTSQLHAPKQYSDAALSKLLGVNACHFKRDWGGAVQLIRRSLRGLEEKALEVFWVKVACKNLEI